MDMPLATIRRVLAVLPVSQAQAELLLRQYLEMREHQIEQIRLLARQFTQQLKPEANKMSLEVEVKEIPTQQIISITRRHTVDGLGKQEEQDIGALFSLAGEQGARTLGAPFGIYHVAVSEQEDGPVETCLVIEGEVEGQGRSESSSRVERLPASSSLATNVTILNYLVPTMPPRIGSKRTALKRPSRLAKSGTQDPAPMPSGRSSGCLNKKFTLVTTKEYK